MKHTVSGAVLAGFPRFREERGNTLFEKGQKMTLVNYMLIGLLGTILALALYAAKWDMSPGSERKQPPRVTMIA